MRPKRTLFRIGSSGRLRALLLALVAVGSCGIAILAFATHALKSLEGSSVDLRFSIRGSDAPPKNLVIVKVDDKTFQDLHTQWPFPRAMHGRLINRIVAEHPAAIAYDVQFSEASLRGQNDDVAMLDAISKTHGKTVFSTTETDKQGNVVFLGSGEGTKLLHEVGSRAANGLFPFDSGGVIRRMVLSIGHLDTLAVVTAQVATGKKIDPKQYTGTNWIDYVGPTGTIPSVSFSDALRGHTPKNFFQGKIVVIGATAPSLQDIHPTATDSAMPGPEIQANAIETVLKGRPLTSFPGWVTIVAIILLGAVVPVISLRLGPVAATSVAFALGGLFLFGEQLAFDSGKVGTVVYPVGALIISGTGSLTVQLLTEAMERIRTRDLFSRFVSESVVDEVLTASGGLRLGGIQREGTVMFTDLRGFTSVAESLPVERVIEVLNHYLGEMSDAILDHGGTLVSYMGDGIFAVFGAPLAQPDHADRALATAREMLEVRLPRFNAWLREEGLSEGFKMGIGLNSGHVMSGHVGSERRVEYAAVGDTTNTASRIEGMTKGTPHQLFLADSTRAALSTPPDDLIFVDEVEVRGREAKIKLWSLAQQPATTQPQPLQAPSPAV
jgi:adenylate cyclase